MEVIGGSLALEGNSRTFCRREKGGKVAIEVIGTVGRVNWELVDFAVGVVKRYVKGGSAYESGEPRH